MGGTPPYHHRIGLPAGAEPLVAVGDEVEPRTDVARGTSALRSIRVPLARPLRRKGSEVMDLLLARPGERVLANQPLARTPQREVRSPSEGVLLAYLPADGSAILLPLEAADPIRADVRGIVVEVSPRAITIAVPGVMVTAAGGSGPAVNGGLRIAVASPDMILEPGALDADAAGQVVVGGSWASAEAITRARAVGVAAIVVGGLHARDLADLAALQHKRSLLGTAAPPFAVLALDGFGRAAMDPARFAWLHAHADRSVTILGDRRRLIVYDASPAPARPARARMGDRVLVATGPGHGQVGVLVEVPIQPVATGSGASALSGLVRLDTGRTVAVALANLEAEPAGA